MTSKKQKYYVVWQGHKPGIYSTWDACKMQVKNYPQAKYKAFDSLEEATAAYGEGPYASLFKKEKRHKGNISRHDVILPSISVDAACSGNPGAMEYRGVWNEDGSELFHFGPIANGTNNIGEFLAIVHALAMLKNQNDSSTAVYSDSKTAMTWIKKKKAKTLLKADKTNEKLFEMIRRAESWLEKNNWSNPLLKWETKQWGEIPADFGRK